MGARPRGIGLPSRTRAAASSPSSRTPRARAPRRSPAGARGCSTRAHARPAEEASDRREQPPDRARVARLLVDRRAELQNVLASSGSRIVLKRPRKVRKRDARTHKRPKHEEAGFREEEARGRRGAASEGTKERAALAQLTRGSPRREREARREEWLRTRGTARDCGDARVTIDASVESANTQ
jgi:hypothetical protein